jgi:hypothetical protein
MKQQTKWFATALALAGGLAMASSVQAQYITNTLSDFHNFTLSATYGSWDADGWQAINGGPGIVAPTITSGPTSFEVSAGGYGSGAYNFTTPISAPGATMFQFTFTLNTTTPDVWVNPGVDISDGTHMVHLEGLPNYLDYGNYHGPATYTLTGTLVDQFGGAPLDSSTVTAFNLEFDPAGNIAGNLYDITYQSLVLLTPVPEPTTAALLALGAGGLALARRRAKAR